MLLVGVVGFAEGRMEGDRCLDEGIGGMGRDVLVL